MKSILLIFFACIGINSLLAQNIKVKGNSGKFKLDKETIAEVDKYKLINNKKEVLLYCNESTVTIVGKPFTYNFFTSPLLPNDTIRISNSEFTTEIDAVPGSLHYDFLYARLFGKYNFVTDDGSLNIENVKAFSNKFPKNLIEFETNRRTIAEACYKIISNPVTRQLDAKIEVAETSRVEELDSTITISYSLAIEGMPVGKLIAKGHKSMAVNERAEIDFKTKIFGMYKKDDILPMNYTILNTTDCVIATYKAGEKKLYTERQDRGASHGIMKPILKGKDNSIQKRIEIVEAIVRYLISLSYI